jgi:hypothetical protein
MMKSLYPTTSVALALAILFTTMLSCNIGRTEEQSTLFDQYYTIEVTSLINSLKNGNMNAFSPVNEEPELLPVDQQTPVDWFQADYFYIANTLYEDVLGKTLQGWQLKSMSFSSRCSYIQNGFQNGRFEFFKVVKEKEQESRIIRFVDIDPRGNFVHVKEWEFYPSLLNLEAIDLAQLKISAERAFQIAEINGGELKRRTVGDACNISLGLYPNSADYKGWIVSYTRSDDSSVFYRIQIDPHTGETYFP